MSTLRTENLDVSISNKTVCDKLTLSIEPGQIWGILGCNGVGKTTLLHTLAGLREADSGSIFIGPDNINNLTRKSIAQKLGLLLQQTEESFPCSVLDTVLTGRHPHIDNWSWESKKDFDIAMQALEVVQLTDMANRSIEQLSGGERQRVAIASLIAQSPDIFLLDEPNSHLDLKHQIQLLNYFSDHAKQNQSSVVMTLHDVNLAQQYCSHLMLLLGNGECRTGKTQELLTKENLVDVYQHPLHIVETEFGTIYLPVKS